MRGQAQPVASSRSSDELRLRAQPSELKLARDYARQAATAFGFDDDGCYEFVYAVNEAVTNAIRHGAPDARGSIRLSVSSEADRLMFTVRDWGRFATSLESSASTSAHGRGFALMANLVDEVHLRIEPEGTIVTLSKICATMCPS